MPFLFHEYVFSTQIDLLLIDFPDLIFDLQKHLCNQTGLNSSHSMSICSTDLDCCKKDVIHVKIHGSLCNIRLGGFQLPCDLISSCHIRIFTEISDSFQFLYGVILLSSDIYNTKCNHAYYKHHVYMYRHIVSCNRRNCLCI